MGFALACYELGTGLPKVPYLLIEDLLESQTIQQAKSIWKIVETWADQLTQEQLFSKGTPSLLPAFFSNIFFGCRQVHHAEDLQLAAAQAVQVL